MKVCMSENNFKQDFNDQRAELANFLHHRGRLGVLIAAGVFVVSFIVVAVFF